MRGNLLSAAVIVLLIGGAALGYGLYQQNIRISKLLNLANIQSTLPVTQQSQVNNTPSQPVVLTSSAIATPPTTTPTMSGRASFGPQVSFDGKWLLTTDKSQTISIPSEAENRLILKGLFGQGDRILATGKNTIQPAGWSADGSKVYYVSGGGISDGCGGAYPEQTFSGDTLYEVNVASGKEKSIFQVKGSGCGSFFGIHDVYASKNLVLFEQPIGSNNSLKYNIYTSDLKGGSKKIITTVTGTDGVTADTLSPDGTRVALVTNHNIEGFDYTYKLLVVGVSGGAKKEITTPKNDGNYFKGWVDNNTISIIKANGTKNIQVP